MVLAYFLGSQFVHASQSPPTSQAITTASLEPSASHQYQRVEPQQSHPTGAVEVETATKQGIVNHATIELLQLAVITLKVVICQLF